MVFFTKKKLLVTIFMFIFVTGCTYFFFKKSLSPSATIIAFSTAATAGDISETKKYVSTETLRKIEEGKFWWLGTYENYIHEREQRFKSVRPKKENITGDIATIEAEVVGKDDSTGKRTYLLAKENGKWKINYIQD